MGGGILRDHKIRYKDIFVRSLKDHTNNQVEDMKLLWRLNIAKSIGISSIGIEGDSKVII